MSYYVEIAGNSRQLQYLFLLTSSLEFIRPSPKKRTRVLTTSYSNVIIMYIV